jgi:hypothetical protein
MGKAARARRREKTPSGPPRRGIHSTFGKGAHRKRFASRCFSRCRRIATSLDPESEAKERSGPPMAAKRPGRIEIADRK